MASLEELVRNKSVTYLRYKGHLYCNFSATFSAFSKCVSFWPDGFTRSEWEAQAGEFQAREDDIWLSSYQKSGEFHQEMLRPTKMKSSLSSAPVT